MEIPAETATLIGFVVGLGILWLVVLVIDKIDRFVDDCKTVRNKKKLREHKTHGAITITENGTVQLDLSKMPKDKVKNFINKFNEFEKANTSPKCGHCGRRVDD